MVPVGINRHWPKTTLDGQVLEEPRHRVGERSPPMRSTAAAEVSNDQLQ
jgi:hypothetical protein